MTEIPDDVFDAMRHDNPEIHPDLLGESELIAFAVTGFTGHYPVGTAAIVYASDREECKRVLLSRLRAADSPLRGERQDPDHWTISPLTPVPGEPSAHVLLDGDY